MDEPTAGLDVEAEESDSGYAAGVYGKRMEERIS